jgi:hypothetical protein
MSRIITLLTITTNVSVHEVLRNGNLSPSRFLSTNLKDAYIWKYKFTSFIRVWNLGFHSFDSRWGLGIFLFTASRTALGPIQPPIQWVPGVLSLGEKRPEREADNSPPSSAEVKNAWSYTSPPQYVFRAWYLVKHRDFTFLPLPL